MNQRFTVRMRVIARVAVACLMLGLWAGCYAVAASPVLHTLLHHDAQSSEHNCAIAQITHQSLLGTGPAATLPGQNQVPVVAAYHFELCFAQEFDFRISLGRAPPTSFSPQTVVGEVEV